MFVPRVGIFLRFGRCVSAPVIVLQVDSIHHGIGGGGEPGHSPSGLETNVVAGVGFSPPRSVNLPFCHLGLLKGRFSSL